MTKPRKKYNPRGQVERIWSQKLDQVWFAGAHCIPSTMYGGVERGSLHSPHLQWLMQRPFHWQVLVMAFNTDGQRDWVDWKVVDVSAITGKPVSTEAMHVIAEDIMHTNAQRCNKKYLVTPAYFAVPSNRVDLEASSDHIFAFMKKQGAFNAELCQMVFYLRQGVEFAQRAD